MEQSDREVEQGLLQIEEWYNMQQQLSSHFSKVYATTITTETIYDALLLLSSDEYALDWGGNLMDTGLKYDQALLMLTGFDFNIIQNKIETQGELIPQDLIIGYKVQVKSKGLVWIIHRYDVDPFPSNPHAHQLDNNIKLDLASGKCYKVRKHIHTIPKKDLLLIRSKAEKAFKGELPKLII